MSSLPQPPDPMPLYRLGTAFAASRALLTAVELELFTHLARSPLTAAEIGSALNLHPRAVPDFPDTLLALGVLTREGDGPSARYANTPATAYYLVKGSPAYNGGFLELCSARLYPFWQHLTEALRTGRPQNEIHPRYGAKGLWESIYGNDEKLHNFIAAMAASNTVAHRTLAEKMDWKGVTTHLDVGGASGQLSCEIVRANPHVTSTMLDLERVTKIAARNIETQGFSDNIKVLSGSFWDAPFPNADVITMGQILHDYSLPKKKQLMQKAYDALNPGGRFVAVEMIIDDDRRGSVPSLLMSLNMIVDQEGGFDFSAKDFDAWAREAGFVRSERLELVAPVHAAVAYK